MPTLRPTLVLLEHRETALKKKPFGPFLLLPIVLGAIFVTIVFLNCCVAGCKRRRRVAESLGADKRVEDAARRVVSNEQAAPRQAAAVMPGPLNSSNAEISRLRSERLSPLPEYLAVDNNAQIPVIERVSLMEGPRPVVTARTRGAVIRYSEPPNWDRRRRSINASTDPWGGVPAAVQEPQNSAQQAGRSRVDNTDGLPRAGLPPSYDAREGDELLPYDHDYNLGTGDDLDEDNIPEQPAPPYAAEPVVAPVPPYQESADIDVSENPWVLVASRRDGNGRTLC